jgi:hypothetical protein
MNILALMAILLPIVWCVIGYLGVRMFREQDDYYKELERKRQEVIDSFRR